MAIHESDICVIGGGITAALLVERLAELKPGLRITVVEAGRSIFDRENRQQYPQARARIRRASVARRLHRRSTSQGHDLDDHGGGRAGAALGRRVQPFLGGRPAAEIDVRPGRRLADRMGRARALLRGSGAPAECRGRPEPVCRGSAIGAVPAAGDAALVQPADSQAMGRTERLAVFAAAVIEKHHGALRRAGRMRHVRHVRRGVSDRRPRTRPTTPINSWWPPKRSRCTIGCSSASSCSPMAAPGSPWPRVPIRIGRTRSPSIAREQFVLASGQCWSPHLLLLSANPRFPNGLANRSGAVGRYMNGHKFISAQAQIEDETFPGQNMTHSLISREYLPLRGRPGVRAARYPRMGELGRPGAAVAQPRGQAVVGRRAARRLARPRAQGQLGPPAGLLRFAPVGRQPPVARPGVEEPLRRSDAEDRAAARRGGARPARRATLRTLHRGCSSAWPAPATDG